MQFIAVLVAAVGAYAFGAVWYMTNAKAWIAAAGIKVDENGEPANSADPTPYIISAVSAIVVAGMMRHMFGMAGIDTFGKGLVSGLGLGLFVAAPWMVNNHAYEGRPVALTLINGGYIVGGCAVIGAILGLF